MQYAKRRGPQFYSPIMLQLLLLAGCGGGEAEVGETAVGDMPLPPDPTVPALYVAPSGDDNWSGTLAEPNTGLSDGPLATLSRARDVMRGDPTINTTYVRGGTYYLAQTLQLTLADAGVSFLAYPGETPVLSGGRPITGWKQGPGGIWTAQVPNGGSNNFQSLIVAGERQVASRYPNFDPAEPFEGGWLFAQGPSSTQDPSRNFIFRSGDIDPALISSDNLKISIQNGDGWSFSVAEVTSIDFTTNTIQLAPITGLEWPIQPGNRYYLFDIGPNLDAPGEWYLRRNDGTIYYLPTDPNFNGDDVVAAELTQLINIDPGQGSSATIAGITISGIQFQDTDYIHTWPRISTIRVAQGDGIVLEGNKLINIGNAILLKRTVNARILNNEITVFARHGITLDDQSNDNLIEGNWLHEVVGPYQAVATGAIRIARDNPNRTLSANNTVRDNLIEKIPRIGISCAGINNIIEYNEVREVNLEDADSGAIYMYGNWTTGNVVRYNKVDANGGLDTTSAGVFFQAPNIWGIYLDGATSDTEVYGNLVTSSGNGGVMIHQGSNNLVENNILIDGQHRQITVSTNGSGNIVQQNIFFFRDTATTVISAGFGLNFSFDRNLYWNPNGTVVFESSAATPLGPFSGWQASGQDVQSLIADPVFVDPAAGDYRLMPQSPAYGLGFVDLP